MQDLKIIVKEIKGYCDTIQEDDYFVVRGGRMGIELDSAPVAR
jgi:hypothetical protein